jgi:hypothetical protein
MLGIFLKNVTILSIGLLCSSKADQYLGVIFSSTPTSIYDGSLWTVVDCMHFLYFIYDAARNSEYSIERLDYAEE